MSIVLNNLKNKYDKLFKKDGLFFSELPEPEYGFREDLETKEFIVKYEIPEKLKKIIGAEGFSDNFANYGETHLSINGFRNIVFQGDNTAVFEPAVFTGNGYMRFKGKKSLFSYIAETFYSYGAWKRNVMEKVHLNADIMEKAVFYAFDNFPETKEEIIDSLKSFFSFENSLEYDKDYIENNFKKLYREHFKDSETRIDVFPRFLEESIFSDYILKPIYEEEIKKFETSFFDKTTEWFKEKEIAEDLKQNGILVKYDVEIFNADVKKEKTENFVSFYGDYFKEAFSGKTDSSYSEVNRFPYRFCSLFFDEESDPEKRTALIAKIVSETSKRIKIKGFNEISFFNEIKKETASRLSAESRIFAPFLTALYKDKIKTENAKALKAFFFKHPADYFPPNAAYEITPYDVLKSVSGLKDCLKTNSFTIVSAFNAIKKDEELERLLFDEGYIFFFTANGFFTQKEYYSAKIYGYDRFIRKTESFFQRRFGEKDFNALLKNTEARGMLRKSAESFYGTYNKVTVREYQKAYAVLFEENKKPDDDPVTNFFRTEFSFEWEDALLINDPSGVRYAEALYAKTFTEKIMPSFIENLKNVKEREIIKTR